MMRNSEGLLPDHADGTHFLVDHGCKCQKPSEIDEKSCCGWTCKDPANSELDQVHLKHSFSFLSRSKKMCTRNKSLSMARNFNSWSNLIKGSTHVLEQSSPHDFSCFLSTEGHCNKFLFGQKRHRDTDTDGLDVCYWPHKLLKSSSEDSSQLEYSRNLKSIPREEGFHNFSSSIKCLLFANDMKLDKCLREPPGFTFTTVKETELSRTVTVSMLHGEEEIAFPFKNFTSYEEKSEICTESSAKTASIDHFQNSSSFLGQSFHSPEKDASSQCLRKSEWASASPTQRDECKSVEIVLADVGVEHSASAKGAVHADSKETCVSRTESMNVEYMPSNVKKTYGDGFTWPDHNLAPETCGRWVKRLLKNHSESVSRRNKGLKKVQAFSCEMPRNFGGLHHHDKLSFNTHNRCKRERLETMSSVSENTKVYSITAEEAPKPWIMRWYHNHHQAPTSASRPIPFEPESSIRTENFKGSAFSSFRAMALMGKAMRNYIPCRFRRKEASLVWST
ncbi:hypothetical protein HPP92_021324 [Vanilla planifolia]|uniref:Uncharacterized protein n=1 Tax=Vanilla planifolia TaxID=51239 RepID=A0A835Q0V7_VANPL|nr:hypothetical protein HPP92_021324 [Vanilla planifolia]